MKINEVKRVLLEILEEYDKTSQKMITFDIRSSDVLQEASKRLKIRSDEDKLKILLTVWHDLYRLGIISWGINLQKPDMSFCHLSDRGRILLKDLNRDPYNPDGYINYLESISKLDDITRSYILEALESFNSNCYKASMVMVGCASENILLQIRDALVSKLNRLTLPVPPDLNNWMIKKVVTKMQSLLDQKKELMPRKLKESYEAYWLSFTQHIRIHRNDAGHPQSIDPINVETTHSSMLMFPTIYKLSIELKSWIQNNYT